MVRPDRVELPTFWFVGMQSDRILLILMPATTCFEANTWRTKAPIDERLMKGFPVAGVSKSTSLRLLPAASLRGKSGPHQHGSRRLPLTGMVRSYSPCDQCSPKSFVCDRKGKSPTFSEFLGTHALELGAIVLGNRYWHAGGEPGRSNSVGVREWGISRVVPPPRPGATRGLLPRARAGARILGISCGDQQSRSVCTEMANILGIPGKIC